MLKLVTTAGGLVVGAQALSMNMKVTKLEVAQEEKSAGKPSPPQSKGSAKPKGKAKAPTDIKEKLRLNRVETRAKGAEKKGLNICDGIGIAEPYSETLYLENSEDNCQNLGEAAGGQGGTFKPRRNIPEDGKNAKVAFTMEDWRKHHIDKYGRVDEGKKNRFWVESCCVDITPLLNKKVCEGIDGAGIIDPIPAAAKRCPELDEKLAARDAKDKTFKNYFYEAETYSRSKEERILEYKMWCCEIKNQGAIPMGNGALEKPGGDDPLLKFVGQNICLGLKDEAIPQFETAENSDVNCAATAKQVSLAGTWKKKEKAEVKFTPEQASKPEPEQKKQWAEGCCEKQETTNTKKSGNKEDEGSCGGDDGSCR